MYTLREHLSFKELGTSNGDSRIYIDNKMIGLESPQKVVLGLTNASIKEALQMAANDMVTSSVLNTEEMPIVVDGEYGLPLKIDSKSITGDSANRRLRSLSNYDDTLADGRYVGFLFGKDGNKPKYHTLVRFGQRGVEILVTNGSETKYLRAFVDAEISGEDGFKTLRIKRGGNEPVLEKRLS